MNKTGTWLAWTGITILVRNPITDRIILMQKPRVTLLVQSNDTYLPICSMQRSL